MKVDMSPAAVTRRFKEDVWPGFQLKLSEIFGEIG